MACAEGKDAFFVLRGVGDGLRRFFQGVSLRGQNLFRRFMTDGKIPIDGVHGKILSQYR